ncbi:MAG TPA: sodium/solute symporter [Phycisphaerae bacterium]|nr:sodium/solute symporter [Phycisphaerae bacterium]
MTASHFQAADWIVFFTYLGTLIGMGWYFSRRQTSTAEFFTSSRRMHWLPVALSVVASLFSAVSFLGLPAMVFKGDCVMIAWPLAVLLATPMITRLLLPFYNRLQVTTAYEYLEKRFGLNVRLLASALFILKRLFWMSLVTLTPSLALSTMTGLRVEYCILVIGLVATLYTTMGGLSAVIWTDAVQFVVFMLAQLLIVGYVVTRLDGGFAEVWHTGVADHKIAIDLSIDFSRQTFWTVLLACIFIAGSDLGADQLIVQRLISTPDIRGAARSLWFNAVFKFPSMFLLLTIGAAVWAFYRAYPDRLGLETPGYEMILPHFIIKELPVGISGLVIAGIFAAAMSSFDSGLHTMVTTFTVDWYKRLIRIDSTDLAYLRTARVLTLTLGVAVTILAVIVYRWGIRGLIDASNSFLGFFGGGLLGVFLLGVLTRRAKGLPTVLGAVAAVALVSVVEFYQQHHGLRRLDPWLYGPITCCMTMVIGYFGSFFGPEPPFERIAEYTTARGRRVPAEGRPPEPRATRHPDGDA